MISASIMSLLLGALLSQKFSVLIMIPATVIVTLVSVGAGIAHADVSWDLMKAAAVAATCLQCGYFAGLGIWHVLTVAPSERPEATPASETSTHPTVR